MKATNAIKILMIIRVHLNDTVTQPKNNKMARICIYIQISLS